MSGTSKAIVSMCVLLLAALVVYYGMTPPDDLSTKSLDLPTHRSLTIHDSAFGGDAYEKVKDMGLLAKMSEDDIQTPADVESIENVAPPVESIATINPQEVEVVTVITPQPVVETATFWLYTFLEGETLGEVATRELGSYNRWREIASLNKINDPARIRAGTVLKLPLPAGIATPTPVVVEAVTTDGEGVYTITEGDTLSSIAEHFYGNANLFNVIVKANPNIDPDRLKIGVKIKIPST